MNKFMTISIRKAKRKLIKSIIGRNVRHTVFGDGIVKNIERDDDPIIRIKFKESIKEFTLLSFPNKYFEIGIPLIIVDEFKKLFKLEKEKQDLEENDDDDDESYDIYEFPKDIRNMDHTKPYAHFFRETGRFGTHPSHDSFDDESKP